MATSVVMPALEMAQETGKIVTWINKEGDAIPKGEILLEVETDKAVVEIEASADGVLGGVKSHAGDVVPVGTTIAWILAPGEQPPAEAATSAPAARTMTEQPRPASPASSPAAPRASIAGSAKSAEVQISPKARRPSGRSETYCAAASNWLCAMLYELRSSVRSSLLWLRPEP